MADGVESFWLLSRPWIPVRRASGAREALRPADLTDRIDDDPVVALDWPRPDLRVACLELLVGLLATACPPGDTGAWVDGWTAPPPPPRLGEAFAPLDAAFTLDGDGPRFCQDLEELPGDAVPIERLLVDSPGENALRRNTDLLVKRGRLAALSRPAAAMALYALQAWAPSGGAGHRVSLRGGGPLTTLVVPGPREGGRPRPLWHLLWANVPQGAPPAPGDLPLVFPWLAPTRRSDAGGTGTALDGRQAHPLQAFWGMPRRLRLDFAPAAAGEACGLTGAADPRLARGFRTRPGGAQYLAAAPFHPLTPVYRTKPADAEWLAVHPQPDGIGYRHWHGLAGAETPTAMPAKAVAAFVGGRHRALIVRDRAAVRDARVLAAGYDMDNMKARGFVEAEMPLLAGDDPAARAALLRHAAQLALAATDAAGLLRAAVRAALAEGADADATLPAAVRARFFEATAPAFWEALGAAMARGEEAETEAAARGWLAVLRRHALAGFDQAAPLDPLSPAAAGRPDPRTGGWRPPPVVEARRNLGLALHGWGKGGQALFARLGLAPPAPAKQRGKKGRVP